MIAKVKFGKRKSITALMLLVALAFALAPMSVAAVNISPSTNEALVDMNAAFTVSGLNVSRTYDVEVNDADYWTDLSPTSGGSIAFNVAQSASGTYKIEVVDDVTDTVVATAQLIVTDLGETLIPLVQTLVVVSIILGVYVAIDKELI